MKSKLTHNLGLKLISLLSAIMIWLIIVYTYDPVDTADFTLDVTILNEEAITSLNKVYEVIEGDTVTIRVKGNTTQISSLRASDFKATADISKLSPTYHASIDVVCTKTNNVEISFLGKVNMLSIRLEDVAQKQFKVTVVPEGTAAEGSYVGTSTAKPNLIQVSGAESAIERIDQVRVSVDVTDATETFKTDAQPKAYDKDGKEIKTGSLTFSKDPVTVTTTIYGTKEIPIEVVAEDEPYSGYRLVGTEYEPKSVIIAGDEEKLAAVSAIQIPVSVANRITSLEETLLLEDYISDDVYLTDPTASVNVFLEIERLATRNYEIPYNTIQLRNSDTDAWDYKVEQIGTFQVKVMGREEELKDLESVSLRPYVDVAELAEEGSHTRNVQFELEDRFEVLGVSTVTIQVKARPELPPEDELPEDGVSDGTPGDEEQQDPTADGDGTGSDQENVTVPDDEESDEAGTEDTNTDILE